MRATGTFEVKIVPLKMDNNTASATMGRMAIAKQFQGALEATSKGEMLTAAMGVKSSAAYVAVEHITGTLDGRSGSFSLQHSGTMTRGITQLSVTVVPDSGTGELTGLAGSIAIIIADGTHSYDFAYTLAEAY